MAMSRPAPPPIRIPPPMTGFGPGKHELLWIAVGLLSIFALAIAIGIPLQAAAERRAQEDRERFISSCLHAGHTEAECRFLMLRDARAVQQNDDKTLGAFLFGLALGSSR